jgi:hypothetical protein
MLIYSNDNEEEYPKAGWPNSSWSKDGDLPLWAEQTGKHFGKAGSDVTITASFYLLVRYADVTTKQFVCKGDIGTMAFKLWDFGNEQDMKTGFVPGQHCSYSYHMPYYHPLRDEPGFPIGPGSNPAAPLCADRNPYLDKNAEPYVDGKCASKDPDEECPTWGTNDNYYDPQKTGNSAPHQREGQNVLFNDGHVLFAKYPNVGLTNDNIWKNWNSTDTPERPEEWEVDPTPYTDLDMKPGTEGPEGKRDSFLVNEVNKSI